VALCADQQLTALGGTSATEQAHLKKLFKVNRLVSRMQTFKSLLFTLPLVCGIGHAQYTGEFSLNIPADAGFGNNFNLITFPDHAPQTQQAEQYDVSLLQQQRLHEQQQQQLLLQQQQQKQQQQQEQAQQRFQPNQQIVQPQRFQQQPAPQSQRFQQVTQPQVQQATQTQRFQQTPQPQRFQQPAQTQRFQAVPQSQGFQQASRKVQQASKQVQQPSRQVQQVSRQLQAATRPSTDTGRFSESRRPEPQHQVLQGGFSNFPARAPARAGTSGARSPAPSFAVRPAPAVPAFRPSPTSPPARQSVEPSPPTRQSVVEPESSVLDFDYDSGLSRFQLFKLRQKAKLAAEKAEIKKEERSESLVKVVKRKKIQG